MMLVMPLSTRSRPAHDFRPNRPARRNSQLLKISWDLIVLRRQLQLPVTVVVGMRLVGVLVEVRHRWRRRLRARHFKRISPISTRLRRHRAMHSRFQMASRVAALPTCRHRLSNNNSKALPISLRLNKSRVAALPVSRHSSRLRRSHRRLVVARGLPTFRSSQRSHTRRSRISPVFLHSRM